MIARVRGRYLGGRPDRSLPLVLLALAILGIGSAMTIHTTTIGLLPILVLVPGILALLASVAVPREAARAVTPDAGERALRGVLGLTIGVSTAFHLLGPGPLAGLTPAVPPAGAEIARVLLVLAGLIALSGLRARPVLGRATVPLLLALVGAAVVATLLASPEPAIDVFVFSRDASAALARGVNPYGIDFPNIYPDERFYGPGVVVDGRVTYGYPYPPLPLAAYLPATVLTGDPRGGNLVAILAAGALIASARPGPVARGAAAVLLLTPSLPFLLDRAYMEPVVLLALAATVAAACRAPRLTGIALGCLLFAKQYCLVVLPFALLLLPRGSGPRDAVRLLATALLVALGIVAPFLLADPAPFVRSVLEWQLIQPFRPDSLGLGPVLAVALGGTLPPFLAFAAAGLAGLVALWRVPATPSGFAWATGLVLAVFVVLSKQAFPNYYLMVLGCLAVAIAVARPEAFPPDTAGTDGAADPTTRP